MHLLKQNNTGVNETFINDSSFNINSDESQTKLLWSFPELKIEQKVKFN